jgi:hypothetical protein
MYTGGGNQVQPCETITQAAVPLGVDKDTLTSGIAFSWITPHKPGGDIAFSWAPTASSSSVANFAQFTTINYDAGTGKVILPEAATKVGRYTIQWFWKSGNYMQCVDIAVLPSGATASSENPAIYEFSSGTYDSSTDTLTCKSGYSLDADNRTCKKKGLSGGAAFGVFLLVFVVVVVGVLVGAILFLKFKKPEKYSAYKLAINTKLGRV